MPTARLHRLALTFYSAFAVTAVFWAWVAGRPWLMWFGEAPTIADIAFAALGGALFGIAIVALTQTITRRSPRFEALNDWFSQMIGPIGWTDAFILALLSGFAEEMLFRGAMQPSIGIIPSAILFALMHWPSRRDLMIWTVFAGVLGLMLGVAAHLTGNIFGPIAAHFTINFFNLKSIGDRARPAPS